MQIRIRLFVAGSLLLSFLNFPAVEGKGNTEPYSIEMKDQVIGRVSFQVTPSGAKVTTTTFTFMMLLPEGRFMLINDSAKRYAIFPPEVLKKKLQVYKAEGGKRHYHDDKEFTPFSPWKLAGKPTLMSGLHATKYTRFRTNSKKPPMDKTYIEEIWFTRDVSVPDQVVGILRTMAGSFPTDSKLGFPIKVNEVRIWQGGQQHKVTPRLETIAFKRPFKAKFEEPKTYKKVKDEMSVFMDDSSEDAGMFGLDGLGGTAGK